MAWEFSLRFAVANISLQSSGVMTYQDIGAYFQMHFSQVVLGLFCVNTDYAMQRQISLGQEIAMTPHGELDNNLLN